MADETVDKKDSATTGGIWDFQSSASDVDVDAEEIKVDLKTDIPHIARIYDYWLGGKTNYRADREVAEAVMKAMPTVTQSVRTNRAFLRRAVHALAAEYGIRQFLDIGTGLPAADNTHEVAQRVAPESRIVYVDNDPIVLIHARALLTSTPEGRTAYLHGDVRDPATILERAAKVLDFSQPIGLMLIAVMHMVPDDGDPYGIVRTLSDAVPAGSYLALSHPGLPDEGHTVPPAEAREALARLNAASATPIYPRTREAVIRFFDGWELLEPGVVLGGQWRANDPEASLVWAGLGRRQT
ncbi:MAG: SAM-dependent methyltransferase [Frankia sp.]|nr:SAM-dependent methyltransferase [Frankia sp.]